MMEAKPALERAFGDGWPLCQGPGFSLACGPCGEDNSRCFGELQRLASSQAVVFLAWSRWALGKLVWNRGCRYLWS